MAIIIVCDGGCGAQSPNPQTKLHNANYWTQVRVAAPGRDIARLHEDDDKRFCPKCWPRVEAALASQQAASAAATNKEAPRP